MRFLSVIVGFSSLVTLTSALSYNDSSKYASGAYGEGPSQSFRSSNYTPSAWNFNVEPSSPSNLTSGSIFLAPRGASVDQPGPQIFDLEGNLVWDGSAYGQTLTFSVQTLYGQPVILLWNGAINGNGYGNGHSLVLDQAYQVVENITTSTNNQTNDFHELAITRNNTMIITVYENMPYDLSAFNVTVTDGSLGHILGCYAQEIDIATGQALFTWASLDHVKPDMSYAASGNTGGDVSIPWDYFHINSIEKDDQGNFLISSRHCHAIYYVEGATGDILWTMNGMDSSFDMGNGSTFEWQHHARWVDANQTQMTVFDNGATDFASNEPTARGLLLNVNKENMTVSLAQEFLPYNRTVSGSQGSVQLQPNGNFLVGWGEQPYFSEYDAEANLLWSAEIGLEHSAQSYRALRCNWTAYPTYPPNISVVTNDSASTYDVYVSWNGATEVDTWNLMGTSSSGSGSSTLLNSTKMGFETMLSIPQSSAGKYSMLQVAGLSSNGSVLGYSDFVSLDGTTTSSALASETSGVTVGMVQFQTTQTSVMQSATTTTPTMGSGISMIMGSASSSVGAVATGAAVAATSSAGREIGIGIGILGGMSGICLVVGMGVGMIGL